MRSDLSELVAAHRGSTVLLLVGDDWVAARLRRAGAVAVTPHDLHPNGHGDPLSAVKSWSVHALADGPNEFADVARRLEANGAQLAIHRVLLPLAARWFGASDELIRAEVRELLQPPETQRSAQGPPSGNGERPKLGLRLTALSDVPAERVRWLWPGRLARGKVHIIDGDPGLGKGTLCADVAARISTGQEWPDGLANLVGTIVWLGAEDGAADTIRPRVDVAGGDASKVHVLHGGNGRVGQLPQLPEDSGELHRIVRDVEATVLVIDPLMAFLSGQFNAHRDQDVRHALSPLYEIADRTGVAVILVRHLNKSGGTNALYRGGGSIGIAGATRLAHLVTLDPDDNAGEPGRRCRLLVSGKNNLGAPAPTLRFRIVAAPHSIAGSAGRVEWLGASRVSAYDVFGESPEDERRSERTEAMDWLRDQLSDGEWHEAKPLADAGHKEFSKATFRRSREALKARGEVEDKREGFGPGSKMLWRLCPPEEGSV